MEKLGRPGGSLLQLNQQMAVVSGSIGAGEDD